MWAEEIEEIEEIEEVEEIEVIEEIEEIDLCPLPFVLRPLTFDLNFKRIYGKRMEEY